MEYDRDLAARFAAVAQEEGVYFHTLWHSGLSAMHTLEDVDEALERIERAAAGWRRLRTPIGRHS